MRWKDEDVQKLRELWPLKSASALQETFGGVFSKNAIISKANRIGMIKCPTLTSPHRTNLDVLRLHGVIISLGAGMHADTRKPHGQRIVWHSELTADNEP